MELSFDKRATSANPVLRETPDSSALAVSALYLQCDRKQKIERCAGTRPRWNSLEMYRNGVLRDAQRDTYILQLSVRLQYPPHQIQAGCAPVWSDAGIAAVATRDNARRI